MDESETSTRPCSIRNPQENTDTDTSIKASNAVAKPLPVHLFYFMGIHFLLAFCEIVLVVPLIRLFEQSLCLSYYRVHDPGMVGIGRSIPEALCKVVEIQQDLATIRGWKSLLDIIPGMSG